MIISIQFFVFFYTVSFLNYNIEHKNIKLSKRTFFIIYISNMKIRFLKLV